MAPKGRRSLAWSLVVLVAAGAVALGQLAVMGEMSVARVIHTATRLPDGRVLIAGGTELAPLASAERYRPDLGAFEPAGVMSVSRYGHSATALEDGSVLMAGGFQGVGQAARDTAEIYDSTGSVFVSTGHLAVARYFHTSTRLNDGRVLLAGGQGNGQPFIAAAEVYDPGTRSFTRVGDMVLPRWGSAAALLPDGRVLITGGFGNDSAFQLPSRALDNAELFDPVTASFTEIRPMATRRFGHTATLLLDNRVLITGGEGDGTGVASAEIFDPASGSFSAVGPMSVGRYSHTATLLPDGMVLVAGGYSNHAVTAALELFDPATSTFASAGSMSWARAQHTATLLLSGAVLIAGGDGPGPLRSAELFEGGAPTPSASDGRLDVLEDTPVAGTLVGDGEGPLTFALVSRGTRGIAILTDAETGAFTYTPFPNANGGDSFTFKVTRGALESNLGTIAVAIAAVEDPPVAVSGSIVTTTGAAVSGVLSAFDVDSPTLRFFIVDNGARGTAVVTDPSTGAFTYTPFPAAVGSDSFSFAVSDAALTSSPAAVAVTIVSGNQPPVAIPSRIATPEDTAVTGRLTAFDPEQLPLRYSIVSAGSRGVATLTNPITGRFRYVPGRNLAGTDVLTFVASDGERTSSPAAVTIDITPVNDAPTARRTSHSAPPGRPIAGTLQAADVDGDPLRYVISRAPRRGAIALDPRGSFVFEPNPGFNAGADSFEFTVSDPAGRSDSATVTLRVCRGC